MPTSGVTGISPTYDKCVEEVGGLDNWNRMPMREQLQKLLDNEEDILIPVTADFSRDRGRPRPDPVIIKGTGWQMNMFASGKWTWTLTGEG